MQIWQNNTSATESVIKMCEPPPTPECHPSLFNNAELCCSWSRGSFWTDQVQPACWKSCHVTLGCLLMSKYLKSSYHSDSKHNLSYTEVLSCGNHNQKHSVTKLCCFIFQSCFVPPWQNDEEKICISRNRVVTQMTMCGNSSSGLWQKSVRSITPTVCKWLDIHLFLVKLVHSVLILYLRGSN